MNVRIIDSLMQMFVTFSFEKEILRGVNLAVTNFQRMLKAFSALRAFEGFLVVRVRKSFGNKLPLSHCE